MISGERSWIVVLFAIAIFGAIFGAAIAIFVAHGAQNRTLLLSAEEVFYRYQTLLVGVGATAFAALSVKQITAQIALQRPSAK